MDGLRGSPGKGEEELEGGVDEMMPPLVVLESVKEKEETGSRQVQPEGGEEEVQRLAFWALLSASEGLAPVRYEPQERELQTESDRLAYWYKIQMIQNVHGNNVLEFL